MDHLVNIINNFIKLSCQKYKNKFRHFNKFVLFLKFLVKTMHNIQREIKTHSNSDQCIAYYLLLFQLLNSTFVMKILKIMIFTISVCSYFIWSKVNININ